MNALQKVTPFCVRLPKDASGGMALATVGIHSRWPSDLATEHYLVISPPEGPGVPRFSEPLRLAQTVNAFTADRPPLLILRDTFPRPSGRANAATIALGQLYPAKSAYFPLSLLNAAYWWTGSTPADAAAVESRDLRLEPHFAKLDLFETGEWNEARGERPNDLALRFARAILTTLKGGSLVPARVLGADERVVLYFKSKDKYVNLECFNSGETLAVKSDGRGVPEVISFGADALESVIDDISAYLD